MKKTAGQAFIAVGIDRRGGIVQAGQDQGGAGAQAVH